MNKRTNSSAPGYRFLVISTQSRFATCTGTREQLIAAGLCQPHQFPQGRARKYFAAHYTVSKARGGEFKWESCREQQKPSKGLYDFHIWHKPEGHFWNTHTEVGLDEQAREDLRQLAKCAIDIVEESQFRIKKSRLTLIAPAVCNRSAVNAAQPSAIQ